MPVFTGWYDWEVGDEGSAKPWNRELEADWRKISPCVYVSTFCVPYGGWAAWVSARVEQWLGTPQASHSSLDSQDCPTFEQAFRKGTLESLESQDGWRLASGPGVEGLRRTD